MLLLLTLVVGSGAGARAAPAAPQYGPLIDIFTINADGTGRTNLTRSARFAGESSTAPVFP